MARAEGAAAKIAADASELGRALDAGQSARLTAARALSGMYVATAGQIPQWLPPARALRRGSGWRDPAPRHPVPVRPGRGHPADARRREFSHPGRDARDTDRKYTQWDV